MKKKAIILTIMVAMALSVTACGSSAKDTSSEKVYITPEGKEKAPLADAPKVTDTKTTKEKTQNTKVTEEENIETENSVVGYYKIVHMTTDGEDITEQIQQLAQMGTGMFAIVNPDGTGHMNLMGEKTDFNWDEKYFHMHDDTVQDADVEYTYADDTLIIKQDSDEMQFVRMSAEEKKDYDDGKYDKTIDEITDSMLDQAYDEALGELDNAYNDAIDAIDNSAKEASSVTGDADTTYLPDLSASKHNDSGYYKIMAFQENLKTYSADELAKAGVEFDMMLCPDGKGYAHFIGTYYDLSWDDGTIYVATDEGQEKMNYFKSDYDGKTIITINDSSMAMVFEYVKEADSTCDWTGVSGIAE
ncbi:hypothetical protein [Butyrivibrio sp. AE3004]|uniref:hypothetical protein n=1 Tax=Butyrivibrio sp. AE3004 TaxID=1506994 RepID=UPI000494C384|nr:hypothetical protein [Butyrivibrio sp. AE3004]